MSYSFLSLTGILHILCKTSIKNNKNISNRLTFRALKVILKLGMVRSWWASRSSTPVSGRVASRGGFDSHPFPLFFIYLRIFYKFHYTSRLSPLDYFPPPHLPPCDHRPSGNQSRHHPLVWHGEGIHAETLHQISQDKELTCQT